MNSCSTKNQSETPSQKTDDKEKYEIEETEEFEQMQIESDPVLERRTVDNFEVLGYTPSSDTPTVTNCHIVVNDPSGKLVSELKYIKSAGHEWNSLSTEFRFVDDYNFEIFKTSNQYSLGAEIDDPNGVDKEEFFRIENPYDIVDQIIEEKTKEQYEINHEGKY